MEKLMCAEANRIDIVDYLASLGYQPQKASNQDYWYLSPLREEKTPSFKVNKQQNVWYDHGTETGGNLVDFGVLYFNCTVGTLLDRLSKHLPARAFSFQPPTLTTPEGTNYEMKTLKAAAPLKDVNPTTRQTVG